MKISSTFEAFLENMKFSLKNDYCPTVQWGRSRGRRRYWQIHVHMIKVIIEKSRGGRFLRKILAKWPTFLPL